VSLCHKNGLAYFFSLAEKLWIIFVCRLVDGLLSSMTESELSELELSEFYRTSPVLNVALCSLAKNAPAEFKSVVMELHKIPEQQIGKLFSFE